MSSRRGKNIFFFQEMFFRLSTPNLWVHAVQEARLVLNHLHSPRRVRVKVGHSGGLCTTQNPAQTMLQTAVAPVG